MKFNSLFHPLVDLTIVELVVTRKISIGTRSEDGINETLKQFILLGDPMFKPYMPKTPEKPIQEEIISRECENGNGNGCVVRMTVTPLNESATKWTYWFEQPVVLPAVTDSTELREKEADCVLFTIK